MTIPIMMIDTASIEEQLVEMAHAMTKLEMIIKEKD